MQEKGIKEATFEQACNWPSDLVAAFIEMEHRNSGRQYEECLKIIADAIAEKLELYKTAPTAVLVGKSIELELAVLSGMSPDAQKEAMLEMIGGSKNAM